jgi:ribosomal protein L9
MASNHRDDDGLTPLPPLPAAPPSRVLGQGYSMNHPVPTVQAYKQTQEQNKSQADEYAAIVEKRRLEAEERERQRQLKLQETESRTDSSTLNGNGNGGGSVSGKKVEELQQPETNVAKNQKDKTNAPKPNSGATEKARMMDQMNANQSKCGVPCAAKSRDKLIVQ